MFEDIKKCLNNNIDVSYKNKLFLAYIDVYGPIKRRGYQVHSENKQRLYSQMFTSVDEAISAFLRLKDEFK